MGRLGPLFLGCVAVLLPGVANGLDVPTSARPEAAARETPSGFVSSFKQDTRDQYGVFHILQLCEGELAIEPGALLGRRTTPVHQVAWACSLTTAPTAALLLTSFWDEGPGEATPSENGSPQIPPDKRQALEQLAEATQAESVRLFHGGELESALRKGRQALAVYEQLYPRQEYPEGTPALAMSLLTLGNVLRDLKQYAEAREHHERALKIYQHTYPAEKYPQGHLAVAVSLNNLGHTLRLEGKHKRSAICLEQAVDVFQRLYPGGHRACVTALSNLADTFNAQGEYRKAAESHFRALDMRERLDPEDRFPQERSEGAEKLHALGVALNRQGGYEPAAECYLRALAIRRRLYPSDRYPGGHRDIAVSLLGLANTRRQQGRYDEARKCGEEALAMYWRLAVGTSKPNLQVAIALNNLGELGRLTGDHERAHDCYTQALRIFQQLFPQEKFPQGHVTLATGLTNIAAVASLRGDYERARQRSMEALLMLQRLYPADRYPQGHYSLALAWNNLGTVLERQGAYERARDCLERSVAMFRRLYPEVQFPEGHPALAVSLSNLASFLQSIGECAQAKDCLEQALGMRRKLYPEAKYPQGHPDLACALGKLGWVLREEGDSQGAQTYNRQALSMRRQLYTEAKFPQGHPELAESLLVSGLVQEAMAMYRRLYSPEQCPQGHPLVAASCVCAGNQLRHQGKYPEARKHYQEALAMNRRLYPAESYLLGHSALAIGLNRLGLCLLCEDDPSGAVQLLQEAATIEHTLAAEFLAGASEAEALNFLNKNLRSLDDLISACQNANQPKRDLYPHVWMRKGLLFRGLALRQQALGEATGRETIERYRAYLQTRRALARLMLAPADPDPKRAAILQSRLSTLTREKEKLERELAGALPEFRWRREAQRMSPRDLTGSLPGGTVLVDFFHYHRYPENANTPGGATEQRTRWYVAFVATRDRPVACVDLGPAVPIDREVKAWREDILARRAGPASAELRRLIWMPLMQELPQKTSTILICPDGALTAIPWAALPGRKPGAMLLEEFAFAVLPFPQFPITERPPAPSVKDPGDRFLAVADVSYDNRSQDAIGSRFSEGRDVVRGGAPIHWGPLPGTKTELAEIRAQASTATILSLSGTEANTPRVLAELPRARWVHFATHGFFADRQFRSALRVDESVFRDTEFFVSKERTTVAGRNPLVLSGLVLASANLPRPTDELGMPQGDGGILAAEAIAGLSLPQLELVVLSACETGRGDVAGGEGVLGLQRAFHQAGARTTIASLWKVDDTATRTLMRELYHNLWQKKLGKLEALRQAQLKMIREYDPVAGELRGPGVIRPGSAAVREGARRRLLKEESAPLPPFFWASFVLSGDWR